VAERECKATGKVYARQHGALRACDRKRDGLCLLAVTDGLRRSDIAGELRAEARELEFKWAELKV